MTGREHEGSEGGLEMFYLFLCEWYLNGRVNFVVIKSIFMCVLFQIYTLINNLLFMLKYFIKIIFKNLLMQFLCLKQTNKHQKALQGGAKIDFMECR